MNPQNSLRSSAAFRNDRLNNFIETLRVALVIAIAVVYVVFCWAIYGLFIIVRRSIFSVVVLIFAMAILAGFCEAELLAPYGPGLLLTASIPIALIFAVLGGGIYWAVCLDEPVADDPFVHSFPTAGIVVGILHLVGALAFPVAMLKHEHQDAQYWRALAPRVQAYGLAHFDEIDADGDGIITQGELKSFINAQPSPISPELQGLQDDFINIGFQLVTRKGHKHLINREELSGYAESVVHKWKKW